jgi:hypothetical protein
VFGYGGSVIIQDNGTVAVNTQWLFRLGVDAVTYGGGVYIPTVRERLVPPHGSRGVDGDWYFVSHFFSSIQKWCIM